MKQRFNGMIGAGALALLLAGCGSRTQELEARLSDATANMTKINQELQHLQHVVQQKDIVLEGATNNLQKVQSALQEKAAALEAANRTIQDKDQQLAQRSMAPSHTYKPSATAAKKKKGKKK